MLAQVCEVLPGADVDVVTSALGLDSRIGGKYLQAARPATAGRAFLATIWHSPRSLADSIDPPRWPRRPTRRTVHASSNSNS